MYEIIQYYKRKIEIRRFFCSSRIIFSFLANSGTSEASEVTNEKIGFNKTLDSQETSETLFLEDNALEEVNKEKEDNALEEVNKENNSANQKNTELNVKSIELDKENVRLPTNSKGDYQKEKATLSN